MIFVTKFDKNIIDRLNNRQIVVQTNSFVNLNEISNYINSNNFLHSILLNWNNVVSCIDFNLDWIDIPISVKATGIGNYLVFLNKIDIVRKLNTIFYLNLNNYIDIQIFSSLGINSGIFLKSNSNIDWEKVDVLFHYYLYTKTMHALIEPFHYILTNKTRIKKNAYIDFYGTYFLSPEHFVYIHDSNNLFLNVNGVFKKLVDITLNNIDLIPESNLYKSIIQSRYEYFINNHQCATCRGFRICLGKFRNSNHNNSCRDFFSAVYDSDFILNNIINGNYNI